VSHARALAVSILAGAIAAMVALPAPATRALLSMPLARFHGGGLGLDRPGGRGVVLLAGLLGAVEPAHAQPRAGEPAPEITGAPWINSVPLALAGLRGRVLLVEFWTYG